MAFINIKPFDIFSALLYLLVLSCLVERNLVNLLAKTWRAGNTIFDFMVYGIYFMVINNHQYKLVLVPMKRRFSIRVYIKIPWFYHLISLQYFFVRGVRKR